MSELKPNWIVRPSSAETAATGESVRRARRLGLVCMVRAMLCLLLPVPSVAQPIIPALLQATSVDAALTVLGASKAVANGRLAIDVEDIVLSAPLKVQARSEIPGTVSMVLMLGAPTGWYGNSLPGESSPRAAPLAPGQPAKPAVLKAWQVPPGSKPILRAIVAPLQQRQAFTLLVSAQGRWYIAVREAKLACEPGACVKGRLSKQR